MTRRHSEALAAALAAALQDVAPEKGGAMRDQWINDVCAIATVCDESNPRFDRARFLKACGVQE